MVRKLTWQEIKQHYNGEWVELVDFDWNMTEPDPQAGIVRVHSKDRNEFNKLAMQDPPTNSAVVFVGHVPKMQANVILNANQQQWFSQK